MANVFGYTEANLGGVFKASESGGFIVSGGGGASFDDGIAFVQQWSAQYQQQVNPVYEVGSSKVYFAVRSASGTLTIARIVGKSKQTMVDLFGEVCDGPRDVTITASEKCYETDGEIKLTCKGVIPQSVGWSGNAQNAYVEEQVTAVFAAMETE